MQPIVPLHTSAVTVAPGVDVAVTGPPWAGIAGAFHTVMLALCLV